MKLKTHHHQSTCNINTRDGCALQNTIMRGSFYKYNPACLSPKRKQQVTNRMYRCYWTG